MSETTKNTHEHLTADRDKQKLKGDIPDLLHHDLTLSRSHTALSESASGLGHAFRARVQRRAHRLRADDSDSDEEKDPSETAHRALMRRRRLSGRRLPDKGDSAHHQAATRIQAVVRGWLAHQRVNAMVLALISQLRGELASSLVFLTPETKSPFEETSTGATSTERTKPNNDSGASVGSLDDRLSVQTNAFRKDQADQDSRHSLGESEDGEAIHDVHFPLQASYQDEEFADPTIPVVPAMHQQPSTVPPSTPQAPPAMSEQCNAVASPSPPSRAALAGESLASNVHVVEDNERRVDVSQEPEVVADMVETDTNVNAPLLEGGDNEYAAGGRASMPAGIPNLSVSEMKHDEAPGWQGSLASHETLRHDTAASNNQTSGTSAAGRLSSATLAKDMTALKGSDENYVETNLARCSDGFCETVEAHPNVDQHDPAEEEEPLLTSLAVARSSLRQSIFNPQQEEAATQMASRKGRRNKAATKIQAIARGFKVRKTDVRGKVYAIEWINSFKQPGKTQPGHARTRVSVRS